ncbi:MAG: NfeD family protein [Bacteroidales bacterium]|nr:NfeD family protein [Bacteroidales bacterium]
MGIWSLWLILGVGFLIAEVLTMSTTCLYIGTGALAAMCGAFLGLGWTGTIVTFVVATVLLYLLTYRWRGKLLRALHKGARHTATGMDALIGRTGTVELADTFRMRIDGDKWQIRPAHPEVKLRAGEEVRVVGYDSIILSVEKENTKNQ